MSVAKRVIFTGRVQGVGFRYAARELAEGFAVTGYVRNLPGGSVELVAEGQPGDVDAYLAAVSGRMADYIRSSTVDEQPVRGARDFAIRY